jgi:hypothetical protein
VVFGSCATDTGWLTVLEKNGLCLAADIFENYGIDSETDLSVLDQDSKLASRGLKPLQVKKLECWCDAVRERSENMLCSSLNTPATAAVLSSEALNVTPAAHLVTATESESENDIERDGEEDDDDSDNDSQIVGEQSCTTDSTGVLSAGTEAPGGGAPTA